MHEPTNHLDMETIDSLARAINNWDGGMVRPQLQACSEYRLCCRCSVSGMAGVAPGKHECKQCKIIRMASLPEPCCVMLQVLVSHDFRLISQV